LIFLFAAAEKVLNWDWSLQYLLNGLCSWYTATSNLPAAQDIFSLMIPNGHFLLILAMAIEAVGGLMVLFGVKPRFGAFLLLLFMVPTTILMHAFWMIPPPDQAVQMIMFFKNISIMGGLLILLACGGKEKAPKPSGE
jgi:uncharacterized membrane protein YphA (DoxX/SURF4 family)